jgi:aspartyl-tRNA(Asn)/glutamyl-tRNA(Gln) amidotransferase subunit C
MGGESAKITTDLVRRLASLAKLRLSPEQIRSLSSELVSILDYMKVLDELSLEDVAPLAALGAAVPLRPDETTPSLDSSLALREAKRALFDHFAVPQVVDLTKRETRSRGEGTEL